ncbi:uncharacterized protein Dmul_15720 [Desulfococcus multivorans]|nr:uncharacterized protein Dmul_15720 [Desulfococcus multivorans]
MRACFILSVITLISMLPGCTGSKASLASGGETRVTLVRMASVDLAAALIRIAEPGDDNTLIRDPGWREYIMEIENRSPEILTVQNVKLLNRTGRYVDSAGIYEQITSPPNVITSVAGDVTGKAAGIAAATFVPCGGTVLSVLSNARTTSSAGRTAEARREFMFRILKNVELAPGGTVEGSAFLPNIPNPKALVVDYAGEGRKARMEIPLIPRGL